MSIEGRSGGAAHEGGAIEGPITENQHAATLTAAEIYDQWDAYERDAQSAVDEGVVVPPLHPIAAQARQEYLDTRKVPTTSTRNRHRGRRTELRDTTVDSPRVDRYKAARMAREAVQYAFGS